MKIQLLIASGDSGYTEHLSNVLAEQFADVFEVSIVSSSQSLEKLLGRRQVDLALVEPELMRAVDLGDIRLRVLLWDGSRPLDAVAETAPYIRKYQRISTIVQRLLGLYAEVYSGNAGKEGMGKITVVWGPSGGSGKTTVALAYGAQQVMEKRKTVYLDFQPFSSVAAYFPQGGKSISSVFEKLDSNVELLLQGIRQTDPDSGLFYFTGPDNYDDISILTPEDMKTVVRASAMGVDEVVVDLGASFDQRVSMLMDLADQVIVVLDPSKNAQVKWQQFCSQHNMYERIKEKMILAANRGAREPQTAPRAVSLPVVQSEDPTAVYKTLSAGYFGR